MATLTKTSQIPGFIIHCVTINVVNSHCIAIFGVMFVVTCLARIVVDVFDPVGYFWPVDSIDFFHDL